MRRKLCALLTLVLVLGLLFGISTSAEESTPETLFEVKYSSDSVLTSGITCEPYVEPGTLKIGFEIIKDLPTGYTIYDSGDTPYIDGIRVNGETVDSLKIIISEDVTKYTVDVKIVYAAGILGDLASMSDGTYDWVTLLENPIVLLQGIYFALAILTLCAGMVSAFFGKRKKVKTADEIASKVSEASETAIVNVEERVTKTVISEVLPIVQKIFDDFQNVVKAVTLSTSKSKEAPIALLDTLKDAANASTSELIDKIQEAVKVEIAEDAAVREERLKTLREFANKPVEPDEVEAVAVKPDTKSVF